MKMTLDKATPQLPPSKVDFHLEKRNQTPRKSKKLQRRKEKNDEKIVQNERINILHLRDA
jgi:hypothetical protein